MTPRNSSGRRRPSGGDGGGHEAAGMMRWLLTYADMITLLLALFIILFSISTINHAKYEALAREISSGFNSNDPQNKAHKSSGERGGPPIADDLRAIKAQLDQYIVQHHLAKNVSTRLDRKGLIVTLLTDKGLFDSGSAEMRPRTREILDEINTMLTRIANAVRVEGNTDDVPIATREYPSNWELSAARATNVVRYLVEHDRLSPTRVSLAGYGEFHPRNPNTTEEFRQLNRRVDIVILSGSLTRVELGEVNN